MHLVNTCWPTQQRDRRGARPETGTRQGMILTVKARNGEASKLRNCYRMNRLEQKQAQAEQGSKTPATRQLSDESVFSSRRHRGFTTATGHECAQCPSSRTRLLVPSTSQPQLPRAGFPDLPLHHSPLQNVNPKPKTKQTNKTGVAECIPSPCRLTAHGVCARKLLSSPPLSDPWASGAFPVSHGDNIWPYRFCLGLSGISPHFQSKTKEGREELIQRCLRGNWLGNTSWHRSHP